MHTITYFGWSFVFLLSSWGLRPPVQLVMAEVLEELRPGNPAEEYL